MITSSHKWENVSIGCVQIGEGGLCNEYGYATLKEPQNRKRPCSFERGFFAGITSWPAERYPEFHQHSSRVVL